MTLLGTRAHQAKLEARYVPQQAGTPHRAVKEQGEGEVREWEEGSSRGEGRGGQQGRHMVGVERQAQKWPSGSIFGS